MDAENETTRLTTTPEKNGEKGDVPKAGGNGSSRRLSGKPPLERVDEVERQDSTTERTGCPDYFGVRSYLHHFYERTTSFKDPKIYEEEEEEDFRYLLNPGARKRRCTSIWWKIFVWIGANLLVFGIIGILVSFLIPQRATSHPAGDNVQKLDSAAVYFNYNLDICKLVSLIVFCVGGVTLTVSLLFPSFLHHYCDETKKGEEEFKVPLSDPDGTKSPAMSAIPATTKLKSVQPGSKNEREHLLPAQEGNVRFQDG